MSHWLFLPDDAIEDIAVLASLSQPQLKTLRNYLDSNDLRPRSKFYVDVAELLDITDESAAKLCGFIHYVHTQTVKQEQSARSIPNELESFLRRTSRGKDAQDLDKALELGIRLQHNAALIVDLFSGLPNQEFSEKVRDLETGPLPHVHSFRTYLDFRPVFNKDATEIVRYVPVVLLSFHTHSAEADEYKDVVIQVSERELAELREQFGRLEKKLAILKKLRLPTGSGEEKRS